MTDTDIAIKVEGVSKSFKLPHDKQDSLKGGLISFIKNGRRTFEKQEVLNDISFEIKKGEFFGVVGRNGSGKSTLLKILAGIYTPSHGSITVNGKLTPFIELGVGFNPELTGRENVFLNGALLGFNRSEMETMYDDIVEFAELERFMDQKLKNYSSGMQVRLAFSIAIQSMAEILVFDEVLAVGDADFQKKCFAYFRELKDDQTRAVILVTHDMSSAQKFCDRVVVLNEGQIAYIGKPARAADIYQELNMVQNRHVGQHQAGITVKSDRTTYDSGMTAKFDIRWSDNLMGVKNVGVAIMGADGAYVFGANTMLDGFIIDKKEKRIMYNIDLNLGSGQYTIKIGLFGDSDADMVAFKNDALSFQISSDEETQGIARLSRQWGY